MLKIFSNSRLSHNLPYHCYQVFFISPNTLSLYPEQISSRSHRNSKKNRFYYLESALCRGGEPTSELSGGLTQSDPVSQVWVKVHLVEFQAHGAQRCQLPTVKAWASLKNRGHEQLRAGSYNRLQGRFSCFPTIWGVTRAGN